MKLLELPDEASTLALGAALARRLPMPANRSLHFWLRGPLGAGKTTLARGVLHSLGYIGNVKSPSFSLLEHYVLDALEVLHVDLYRLSRANELQGLGLPDFDRRGVLWLVEWPERAEQYLPSADLRIDLAIDPAGRRACLSAHDPALGRWLSSLEV